MNFRFIVFTPDAQIAVPDFRHRFFV